MNIEVIGVLGYQESSEIHEPFGPRLNLGYVETSAKAHERAGFDRVLLAFDSSSPESMVVAAHAGAVTQKLKFMIAHRPGFTQPTVAARQLATLDVVNNGRTSVHVVTGGNDNELRGDGSWIGKDERYKRTSEYLDIMRMEWAQEKPFDYEGQFYRVESAFSGVKPVNGHIPIFFGGASEAAIAVAAKHADVFAMWGETHDQACEIISKVRAESLHHRRDVQFCISLRPILADTEEGAWARADSILERIREITQRKEFVRREPSNEGSRRLLAAASRGTRLDKRLWTSITNLLGAQNNANCLVGTPEQVADALLDYYDFGVTRFMLRGFDPLVDIVHFGNCLIPQMRLALERRKTSYEIAEV